MKIIIGLFCLFFIILFHELGHFFAAKLFGVKVESFSIGIGPWYIHKKIRGTDLRLSLIPLGGYCGLKGEKDFSKALEQNLPYIEGEKDSMYGVHPLKRALIAFAGPFFNILLAWISFSIIAIIGYTYYSYSNQIRLADEVYPELQSAARKGGLISGDKIVEIDGKMVSNFSDIVESISVKPDEDITIIVERNGEKINFTVHTDFDKKTSSGKIGITAFSDEVEKYESKTYSFFPALFQGVKETGKYIFLTFKGIASLFKGADLSESISGPARTADIMGQVLSSSFSESLKSGFVNLLNLLALISISLGIMNLLPVPILDGGLIIFALIEFFSRRRISPKILYYIQFVGLAFIGILFLIGLFGDVKYFLGNFRGLEK